MFKRGLYEIRKKADNDKKEYTREGISYQERYIDRGKLIPPSHRAQ